MVNDEPEVPWADEIPAGAFITKGPTFKVGEYFDRFHMDVFRGTSAGDLRYYFYDPTEHGYPEKEDYPLIIFLHGVSNSLEGDVCINYTGAEFFATDEYQADFGGAYLLVPLANEKNDDKGMRGFWGDEYTVPLYDLIHDFIKEKTPGVGKKIIIGNSAGGLMAFKMVTQYTDSFDALLPAGSGAVPDDIILDRYDEKGIYLFIAMSMHDELHDFDVELGPRLSRLRRMKHCVLFTPDWTYSGDHCIQSIYVNLEMGQHCIINPLHANLKFDDGTPMDEKLPRGVTGWIDDVIHNR
ncbi:MAG: hypothetical protein KBT02_10400 [Treponema sp.]|nr:hypothetical protein [Candidatus Treponema caballi]